jgi:hypothetical protein
MVSRYNGAGDIRRQVDDWAAGIDAIMRECDSGRFHFNHGSEIVKASMRRPLLATKSFAA